MKKTLIFTVFLSFNSAVLAANLMTDGPKKNRQGFWTDENAALHEASKTKKPLLIDFFGIWCPPCNQLDELVFATTEFKKAAKNYVLLKLDADKPSSWLLKTKYKVWGYPTIIMARTEDNLAGPEMDRIVGFLPVGSFTAQMKSALDGDSQPMKTRAVQILEKSYTNAIDNDDEDLALKFTEAGLLIDPQNKTFRLGQLKIRFDKKEPRLLESKFSKDLLADVSAHAKDYSAEQLVKAYDIDPRREIIEELSSRLDEATLFVTESSLNEADIFDLAVSLEKSDTLKQSARQKVIHAYERLLKKYGEDTRSLNMGLIATLQEAGEEEKAKALARRLIQKYPDEFTFHHIAARVFLKFKDLPGAKTEARKAVKLAYGENKFQAIDRALTIALADKSDSAFRAEMLSEGETFLENFPLPETLTPSLKKRLDKLTAKIVEVKKAS